MDSISDDVSPQSITRFWLMGNCVGILPLLGALGRETLYHGKLQHKFLLCHEVLSSIVSQANREGVLSGVPTSKKGSKIIHLFFADDNLLFCKTTLAQCSNLSTILQKYKATSG